MVYIKNYPASEKKEAKIFQKLKIFTYVQDVKGIWFANYIVEDYMTMYFQNNLFKKCDPDQPP